MDTEITPSAVAQTTLTTPIHPEEAIERLVRLETPHVPTFYACGIIDAGIGYYQLFERGDTLILLFAHNLEELQVRESPGSGKVLANPGPRDPVNAYDKSASPADILDDLLEHQKQERQKTREYTLVRTEPDIYRSRDIGYALRHHKARDGKGNALADEVGIDAFFNSLHKGYAPAAVGTDGPFYDRMRASRIPIGEEHLKPERAVFSVLDHFTRQLNKLAEGREGIDGEDGKLGLGTRIILRSKMYGIRIISTFTDWLHGKTRDLKEHPVGFVDILARGSSAWDLLGIVVNIMNPEGAILKLAKDVFDSVWGVFGFEPKDKEKIPELLQPYVVRDKKASGFNLHSYHLDPAVVKKLRPLTLAEADIAPPNVPIVPGTPFDVTKDRMPDFGALRAPMGAILQGYKHTTLLLQANGVWMAMQHETDKLFVGYNNDLDTDGKPHPAPILNAWLDAGKVLCYSRASDGHARKAIVMEWKEAAKELQEITASGEGNLLATHKPAHDLGPYVIPAVHVPTVAAAATPANDAGVAPTQIHKWGEDHRQRLKNRRHSPKRPAPAYSTHGAGRGAGHGAVTYHA